MAQAFHNGKVTWTMRRGQGGLTAAAAATILDRYSNLPWSTTYG